MKHDRNGETMTYVLAFHQGIRVVFTENVADPRLLRGIADETDATVGVRSIPARSPTPTVRRLPIST